MENQLNSEIKNEMVVSPKWGNPTTIILINYGTPKRYSSFWETPDALSSLGYED